MSVVYTGHVIRKARVALTKYGFRHTPEFTQHLNPEDRDDSEVWSKESSEYGPGVSGRGKEERGLQVAILKIGAGDPVQSLVGWKHGYTGRFEHRLPKTTVGKHNGDLEAHLNKFDNLHRELNRNSFSGRGLDSMPLSTHREEIDDTDYSLREMSTRYQNWKDSYRHAQDMAFKHGSEVMIRKTKEFGKTGFNVSLASKHDPDYEKAEIVKPEKKVNEVLGEMVEGNINAGEAVEMLINEATPKGKPKAVMHQWREINFGKTGQTKTICADCHAEKDDPDIHPHICYMKT